MSKPTDIECAAEYYRAATEQRSPRFVPSQVRLPRRVCGDFPFHRAYADAGIHPCRSNAWGALSVTASDGSQLGIKPREFEPLEWVPNPKYEAARAAIAKAES